MEKKLIDTDVAILGGGPAGLSAAITVAREGLRAVIFEKAAEVGGAAGGGTGPFAVESYLQDANKIKFTREDAFNYHMEFTQWRVNARLVSEYINKSADTIDWLSDMGVSFKNMVCYFPGGAYTWHSIGMSKERPTQIMMHEVERLKIIDVYLSSSVTELILEGGKVTGLKAKGKDGTEYEVRSRAVVLAGGGFCGNPEFVGQLGFEIDKNLYTTPQQANMTGDGPKLAWSAGAARGSMFMDMYAGLANPYGGPGGVNTDSALFAKPNLMVNLNGERIMNEHVFYNPGYAGNAVHKQPEGCAVMILDDAARLYYEELERCVRMPEDMPSFPKRDITLPEVIAEAKAKGFEYFYEADSIEGICEQAGLDVERTKRTLDEYNLMCDEKVDTLYHKPPQYMRRLGGSKFYAAKFFCIAYGGLGGINISHRAAVLDGREQPIPGLYAAGNDANTIYGGTYPFYLCGNTSGFAYNTGRIAGESIIRLCAGES